jgi:hypothetical protein
MKQKYIFFLLKDFYCFIAHNDTKYSFLLQSDDPSDMKSLPRRRKLCSKMCFLFENVFFVRKYVCSKMCLFKNV